MDYHLLISFSLATATLAISPGPDNIFVLVQSMAHGKRYGLATMAGLMTGCLVHTTLLAFGVSAVINENPAVFYGIKIFGALYLIYLAVMVFRSDGAIALSGADQRKKGLGKLYVQGFFMNVLNPKVTLFFLAFFPGFLFSDVLSPVVQFYTLGAVFILVSSLIFGSIALLSGQIAKYIRHSAHVGQVLKWLQILVFLGIALYLLLG